MGWTVIGRVGAAALAAAACGSVSAAQGQEAAQESGARPVRLAPMALSDALRSIAVQTKRDLIVPEDLVRGLTAPQVDGLLTAEEAVEIVLRGTALRARKVGSALVVEPAGEEPDAAPDHAGKDGKPEYVVTGTRIRGAPVASPVIRLTRDDIRASGQSTLAEAVRTIPQNFGGGQNPTVGNNVPASSGVNVGGATSVNLRGLGSDATLTLLNGHRLSYSASRQAIDISTIPLGAVDRLEVVPDGASALYGSDAVAGVVNVILRNDFDGLEASARIGRSTDGGGFEQRYGLVAGRRWSTGGFFAAYEFGRTTSILGKDRSYTARTAPALTLVPSMKNHNVAVSGHQDLGQNVRFELDGLFNHRSSRSSYALNSAGDISQSGARFAYSSRSFVIAPTLRWLPGSDWNLFLTGSYGQDHTRYAVTSYFQGQAFEFPGNCYCNDAKSLEFGATGSLFRLPGGPAKLASGAGWRSNRLVRFNGTGAATNIAARQASYYAYGEISLPLAAPEQQLAWADRLSLSGAVRFEHYPHVATIATPKVGLIYAPSADVLFKGSWGKSFRAPTLYQQYEASNVVLADPAVFGGTGYPAGRTALLLEGGNPDLRPERATSWSATAELRPRALDGARLELSYFSTRYRDRVVEPIQFLSQALSNASYGNRLTFDPAADFLNAIVAGADSFGNITDGPYDPADVAVFIDDRNVNAGYQKIRGVDLLASYTHDLPGAAGTLSATLNATRLDSEQQTDAGQPVLQLAGIIFNPPHWRARAGLTWARSPWMLTANLNRIGGVRDTRNSPPVRIGGMTTFDLTAVARTAAGRRVWDGLEGALTIQNMFNVKPRIIATTLPSDAPYDSTNYSPVGRFIAASLRKRW